MALVTDKFRIYAAEAFRNTLASVGSDANKVYLFVGRPKSWGTSDTPPTNEPIDSFSYARTTYSDAVSFKRVDISDTALVILESIGSTLLKLQVAQVVHTLCTNLTILPRRLQQMGRPACMTRTSTS